MSNLSDKDLIDQLKSEFGFWESTAIAFIESQGLCVYCGEDLYSSRIRYASQNIEHLYPQSKFNDLKDKQCNLVLSCFKCNNMKRGRELYPETSDPLKLLTNDKQYVIGYIRNKLKDEIDLEIEVCKKLNKILPWVESNATQLKR